MGPSSNASRRIGVTLFRRDGAIFETTACINCHAVAGTVANGRFGPDLTHLMSRDTIAAGAVPNTPENLRPWMRESGRIQTGFANAGHGVERPGTGRADGLPEDAAVSRMGRRAIDVD